MVFALNPARVRPRRSTSGDAPPMHATARCLLSAVLLCLPALALAAAPEAAEPATTHLDSGTLGLLGAGVVLLGISLRLRRRS